MKLKTLQLENFQGIKRAEFDFNGQSATIYGDNATGKTTVFNALTWLLFDKASTGAKGFTPKTRTAEGDAHNLNHLATATFIMDDGHCTSFTKIFHEIYKKKKGSATSEFSGHTTDYYIDGVPVKEREYKDTLSKLGGNSEKMKLLTMPNYFAEMMTVEMRRRLLLAMCGDIGDDELIDSTPELNPLKELLAIPGAMDRYYTVDEFKKLAWERKKSINKELQEIPSRIDEIERSAEVGTDMTLEQIDEAIDALEIKISNMADVQAKIFSGESAGVESINEKLRALDERQNEIRLEYARRENDEQAIRVRQLGALKANISVMDAKIRTNSAELDGMENERVRLIERREQLIAEYNRVNAQVFDESTTVCPTCGRGYPAERVHKMREAFNVAKSSNLELLNKRGRAEASKEMIAVIEKEIAERKQNAADYEDKIVDLRTQLKTLEEMQPKIHSVEDDIEYREITAEMARLKAKKLNAEKNKGDVINTHKEQIKAERMRLDEMKGQKVKKVMEVSSRKRVAELQDREKELAEQYEKLEQTLYLCDQFIQAKVARLTQKTNERFKRVSFRLFQTQINGGLKEDCEVMIPTSDGRTIPFTFANNAARINAGLEIISVLSEYWGVEMPVVIDNAESVTRLTETQCQTIRLVVSEQDKKLRLEVERCVA